ncbi:Cysteine-rich, acidic integral membrane protein-like 2 [Homarus americanus]|uniref:Cysteine-rich, acidic integral membrane protein-like 2 n=1 Tax=Homarus americanus TaxID=6706 RepID=A0A8J5N871_HOMAM|nr:Cysteine-rich, acidic integral membrane protein-like 2 [Homarus americanus]
MDNGESVDGGGEAQSFTVTAVTGEAQSFTVTAVTGEAQNFTVTAVTGEAQSFTVTAVTGEALSFTVTAVTGEAQSFTVTAVTGEAQSFTVTAVTGEAQSFTVTAVTGEAQSFTVTPVTSVTGEAQSFTVTAVTGEALSFTVTAVTGEAQSFTVTAVTGEAQSFTVTAVTGEAQSFTVTAVTGEAQSFTVTPVTGEAQSFTVTAVTGEAQSFTVTAVTGPTHPSPLTNPFGQNPPPHSRRDCGERGGGGVGGQVRGGSGSRVHGANWSHFLNHVQLIMASLDNHHHEHHHSVLVSSSHHYDAPGGLPEDVEALAKIVPSSEQGLSVLFLSGSPPRGPTPSPDYDLDSQPGYFSSASDLSLDATNTCVSTLMVNASDTCGSGITPERKGRNTCVIPVTHTAEGVVGGGDDGEGRDDPVMVRSDVGCDGGQRGRAARCCIISVVSNKEVEDEEEEEDYEMEGRRLSESTNGRKDHTCKPSSLISQEPSARIVLKGSIAFTHDGVGSEGDVHAPYADCYSIPAIDQRKYTEESRRSALVDTSGDDRTRMLTCAGGSYVESYLPEAPPRQRRSRTRMSSDSAIYVGGDSEEQQSGNEDLLDGGQCSTSLFITFGYGQQEDDEGFPILSDPADTEDDSVFAGDVQESRHKSSVLSEVYRTTPCRRRYSASDFIRDTILTPLDKSNTNAPSQTKRAPSPTYVNVPLKQPKASNTTQSSRRESPKTKTKRESKKSVASTKESEKRLVNIEFITRELPPDEQLSATPVPPPRTKSPTKNRARSSSPRKRSDTPRNFANPRRSRSCCLHYRESHRRQEYLQENGISPKSLLDSFFESGMTEEDQGSLPWDFKDCTLYQLRSVGGLMEGGVKGLVEGIGRSYEIHLSYLEAGHRGPQVFPICVILV